MACQCAFLPDSWVLCNFAVPKYFRQMYRVFICDVKCLCPHPCEINADTSVADDPRWAKRARYISYPMDTCMRLGGLQMDLAPQIIVSPTPTPAPKNNSGSAHELVYFQPPYSSNVSLYGAWGLFPNES